MVNVRAIDGYLGGTIWSNLLLLLLNLLLDVLSHLRHDGTLVVDVETGPHQESHISHEASVFVLRGLGRLQVLLDAFHFLNIRPLLQSVIKEFEKFIGHVDHTFGAPRHLGTLFAQVVVGFGVFR